MSLLSDRRKFVDNSRDNFIETMENLEPLIFSLVMRLIQEMDREDGVLTSSTSNLNRIIRLSETLKTAFQNSTINRRVMEWVTDFEQVKDLGMAYWAEKGFDITEKIEELLSFEQRTTINNLVDNLTGNGVETNVIQGIQQRIKQAVVMRGSEAEAIETMRDYLLSDEGGDGAYTKYVKVITQDSIRGYDGTVNKVVSDEYGMDAFRYVGSLIRDSRTTCVGLVRAPSSIVVGKTKTKPGNTIANPYADLVLENGLYLQSSIPEIISRSSRNPGWNPATTPATFFVYRGGYNCRHEAIPTRLSPRQRELYLTDSE